MLPGCCRVWLPGRGCRGQLRLNPWLAPCSCRQLVFFIQSLSVQDICFGGRQQLPSICTFSHVDSHFKLKVQGNCPLPQRTGPAIVKREAHTQGPASILCSGKLWLVLVNGVVLTGDKQRGDVRRHQSPLWVRSPQIWSLVPYMPQLPMPNLVKFHHQYKAVHHKYERAVSRSRDRVRMYDNGTWPEISTKRDLSSLPLPLPCAPASHRHGQACWSRTSSQV